MEWTIAIAFYLGSACYVAAAAFALWYLRAEGSSRALTAARRALVAGGALLMLTFAMRWARWGCVPLTTMVDSLNLFAVLTTLAILCLLRWENAPALLCFYAPPLGAACLMNAATAFPRLHAAPRTLPGAPLVVHVGMVFFAYALFYLASMTSAAYVFQAARLKARRTTGLFQRLPALEKLEHILWRLIVIGYPIFVATLALGLVWVWLDRGLLEARWWLAPKVVMSWVMVAFYAATFHVRRSGRLRGHRLAYLVFVGFSVLLAVYVVLALMNLRDYHFWGTAA